MLSTKKKMYNLKYKLSFANHSSGSKEARIRGVSLQY